MTKDELLTTGFRRPSSLVDEPNYVSRPLALETQLDDGGARSQSRYIIIVGQEQDKGRQAQRLLLSALFSSIVGIGIGIATRKIVNGAAIAGAMLTFVNAVQAAFVLARD